MRVTSAVAIYILLTMSFSACSNTSGVNTNRVEPTAMSLWNNPAPLPSFIESIYLWSSPKFPKTICVNIDEESLWEGGFVAAELTKHINDTSVVEVDGSTLQSSGIILLDPLTARYVFDKDRTVIGSYSAVIGICFDMGNLREGFHTATLRFFNLSAKEYSYTWSMQVTGDLTHASPELMPTLVSLPEFPHTLK